MALPKTESFTGADGTALHTYDANWVELYPGSGGCSLSGNKVTGAFGAAAVWAGDTFNNDQYAQSVVDGTSRCGPIVRGRQAGDASHDYYIALCDNVVSGSTFVQICSNAARTTLATLAATVSGHTSRIEIQGSTIRVYDNGVQIDSGISDATFADGFAGVGCVVAGTQDTWEGGNLSAGAAAAAKQLSALGVG